MATRLGEVLPHGLEEHKAASPVEKRRTHQLEKGYDCGSHVSGGSVLMIWGILEEVRDLGCRDPRLSPTTYH